MQTPKPLKTSAWMCIGVSLLLLLAPVQAGVQAGIEAGGMGTPCPGEAPAGHPAGLPWYGCRTPGGSPGAPAFAVEQRAPRPELQTLGLAGMGIAVSSGNASDFRFVRIGIATVRVPVLDQETEVSAGALLMDDVRYNLRDISIGTGRLSASIFAAGRLGESIRSGDQKIGTLDLALRPKSGMEVWVGKITLDGVSLNLYILQPSRPPNPMEYGRDVRSHCETNPSACQGVAPSGCDPSQPGCRAEIEQYCASNQNDTRCYALQRSHCTGNPNDVRCRNTEVPSHMAAQLTTFCQQKPNLCSGLGTTREEVLRTCMAPRTDNRCWTLFQNYCAVYPSDPGCQGKPAGPPFGPPSGPGGQPGTEMPPDIARMLETFCQQQRPDLCGGLGSTRVELARNCATAGSGRCSGLIQAYCAATLSDTGSQAWCQEMRSGAQVPVMPMMGGAAASSGTAGAGVGVRPPGGPGGQPGPPGGPGGRPGAPGSPGGQPETGFPFVRPSPAEMNRSPDTGKDHNRTP